MFDTTTTVTPSIAYMGCHSCATYINGGDGTHIDPMELASIHNVLDSVGLLTYAGDVPNCAGYCDFCGSTFDAYGAGYDGYMFETV